jgi:hypothetical protein
VVWVGSEDDRMRRSIERCSGWKKRWCGVTCGHLRVAVDSSGRRPKIGRCSRRSPWHSPTGGSWRGSGWCCSVVARQSKAQHPRQLQAGVRERGESCELLRLEQREDKAHVTWGRRGQSTVRAAWCGVRCDRDAVSRARDR